MGIAGDIVQIVVAALVCGLIAQRFKMPALLGYIVAGILIGPNTIGPKVVHVEQIEVLADIGVALLLFSAGLEFPVERLSPVKKIALIGTPLQILASIVLGGALGACFGWNWVHCIWFGCIISVSSTMVVLKILGEKGLTGTLSSQVMTAILIIQDLAVIPMIILLPELNNLSQGMDILGMAIIKSVVLIGFVVAIGSTAMPKFIAKIAALGSRELFMVTVLAIGLGLGLLTYTIGLSFAFGAFLAGMILSRSDFSHHALSEITPLRDLFSLLFFCSVGMLIQPQFIVNHWVQISISILVLLIGKVMIFGTITRIFGYVNIMPIAVGLYMFQVGEFAFVLARTGISSQGITKEIYLLSITVAAITIAITPFFANMADPIYKWWRKRTNTKPINNMNVPKIGFKNHAIIVGYGSMGSFLAEAIPDTTEILIIESHPQRVKKAKEDGYQVIGGNAASSDLLKAANVEEAALMIITIPDSIDSTMVQESVTYLNPKLKVMARARSLEHMKELVKHGCSEALVPEYEACLTMMRDILVLLKVKDANIEEFIQDVRTKQYSPILVRNSATKKKT
ncbi:MAG: cation:proton antiporter [Candidatus Bruticola sp.]